MEHLEDVEQARFFVEESKKLELAEIAAELDAANEQEDEELAGGLQQHPDYEHLHPGEEETPGTACIYRKIEVPDMKVLKETTLGLDPWQRRVVDIAVKYARDIRKAEKLHNRMPKPPHLMVHGGAGAGKTTVIKTLCAHVERILRRDGDETGLPYIVRCAPTGAAASLIEGMTLHKAFNFAFSGKFFSLDDKTRDQKRAQLRNLVLLIIDEVSMVKVEMLYQLCIRLQEIKQRPGIPFGGVCLMCFGDILQLKPVFGHYIFERPKTDSFQVLILIMLIWIAVVSISYFNRLISL